MTATYSTNTEHNGIEIAFDSIPKAEIRTAMKAQRFRWHREKKVWYAKNTPERLELAKSIAAMSDEKHDEETVSESHEETDPEKTVEEPRPIVQAPANRMGIKVGDIFNMSWGYDQTNNTFFQVIKLVGDTSVRLVEVALDTLNEEAISSMSRNVAFATNKGVGRKTSSVFIKDQENGDLKRVRISKYDNKPYISYDVGTANPYHGEKLYESSYA